MLCIEFIKIFYFFVNLKIDLKNPVFYIPRRQRNGSICNHKHTKHKDDPGHIS